MDFHFGSLKDVRAEGGDGQTREGYFKDQVIALVHVRGVNKPLAVIVQCLNGVFQLPENMQRAGMQHLGNYTPVERFTIGPREGLTHHVDFPTAINLADRFDLPLYKGREMSTARRITPDQARALEDRTDWVQVTVYVVEGDIFDLRDSTFIPSSRRLGDH